MAQASRPPTKPLYNRPRDMALFNTFNQELLHNIISTPVVVYKVSTETQENIYGESTEKTYTKGLQIGCLVTHEEQAADASEGFGPEVTQNIQVAFHRDMLNDRGFYPEIGDVVEWNESYFEIYQVVENQLVGGQIYKNFSIVAYCSMSPRDKILIENVRVGDND